MKPRLGAVGLFFGVSSFWRLLCMHKQLFNL
jgi:hypothetical protein